MSARVRIEPWGRLLVASDLATNGPEMVTGVNPAANTLANLTIRAQVEDALDLGTGCGIQALAASAHSGEVIATDVNPRALALCRLNAALNGIENVEPVEGSLFDPVAGRRFGLLVANPPYVISPDSAFRYRDGGLPGDQFCETVVRAAPAQLEAGGTAQITCNWVERGPWSSRPEGWLEDSGCDALVLSLGVDHVLPYASAWNQALRLSDHDAFSATLRRWLDHYASTGIELIRFGAVVLRRRADGASTRLRALEVAGAPLHPVSDHLVRLLDAFDAPTGADLLASTPRLADGVVVDQSIAARDGSFARRPAVVRDPGGLALQVTLDQPRLRLVLGLDGRSLAEVADEAGCDREAALLAVEELVRHGLMQVT